MLRLYFVSRLDFQIAIVSEDHMTQSTLESSAP